MFFQSYETLGQEKTQGLGKILFSVVFFRGRSVPVLKSAKPQQAASEHDQQQDSTDLIFYTEVDISDLRSQYAEEVETFRHILDLPDPRETMPRSSTTVLGLDDEKGQRELRQRGPSAMLPLNPILKDAFEKFEQVFLASNLPEGKYIKPPASTAKYYKLGQPCFELKLQKLNTDFAKICISPKPSGAPMGKIPIQVLKELEHQARQNLSTINFTATFTKTAFACNTTMEKCRHSLKAAFKMVQSPIQKGANPERAARCGYEKACDYFEIKKRFCHKSQVFQFTSLPFGLATAHQVFTMIVKEVKLMALTRGIRFHQYLDDWLIRAQTQEEEQVNNQTVVDLTQSLGWIINQEKCELKVFLFVSYEYHLDSALVKPTQERWLKFQDLILRLKSKHVLTARCLSLIGLLASMEKMVPEGCLHMRPFQFHLKEHWRYPQSLDNLLLWTETISAHLDRWQNPTNMMKGTDLYPKDYSIQVFPDLKRRLGRSLRTNLHKGSVVRQGKKATHKCSRAEGGGCHGKLNSSSLQARRNPLGGDVCSPVENHDLVPSLQDNIKSQTHSRVSECDGRPTVQVKPSPVNRMVTASAGVQTDLSQVVHPSCRSICHSSEPQTATVRVSSPRPECLGHRCSKPKLVGSHSLCLPSNSSPSQGDPRDQTMQLPHHCNSPRLARDAPATPATSKFSGV